MTGVYLSEPTDSARTATVVVTEDQLSLAIGRSGQNARLAAKLTGWRIDIKSLIEATADSLYKLENDSELAGMMPKAVEEAPAIEAMLAKKAEGRSLSPEEYQTMSAFMDRVERRTIEVQEEADRVEQERIAEIRANIAPVAFEMELSDTDLKEHIFNILFEADYETVGDLMLSLELDSAKVFDLPGIGPKALEHITEVMAAMTFPDPELEEEVIEEIEPDESGEEKDEEIKAVVEAEVKAEIVEEVIVDTAKQERIAEVRAKISPAAFAMTLSDADLKERVLSVLSDAGYETVGDLMLSLQLDPGQVFDLPGFGVKAIENMTEVLSTITFPDEEATDDKAVSETLSLDGEEDEVDAEGKKKQKKKFIKYEFDPELGEVVAQKKRKRKSDEWDEEDW